jgi:hypothetical protein
LPETGRNASIYWSVLIMDASAGVVAGVHLVSASRFGTIREISATKLPRVRDRREA